jgi:Domain of unknown function (DUF4403)
MERRNGRLIKKQMPAAKKYIINHYQYMRTFLFYLLLVLITASCKSTKPLVEEKKPMNALPPLPESQINIPVKVFIKPYLAKAEAMAAPEFTSTNWPDYLQTSCDFRYKYRFVRSAFLIKAINNKLLITMNGNYQVAGSKTVCAFGKQVSPWVSGSCGFGTEPMRKVNIIIGSQLAFNSDYTMRATTTVDKITALDKCTVTVFNNDLTAEVVDSIKASVNAFGAALDKTIAAMKMTATTQKITSLVGKKIVLKNYGYIKANPSAIKLGYLNIVGDTLYTTLGINGFPEITSDSINHSIMNYLPPLTTANLSPGFIINANAVYDYTTLDTIVNQTTRNKEFMVSEQKVIIKKIDVNGLDKNRVEMRVDFTGSKTGSIYLVGTPVLDVEKQILSIPDLDYSLTSKNLLLNVGSSLFYKKILQTMREKAVMNVSEIYRNNKPKLDAAFNRTVKNGIATNGYSTGLKLLALVVRQDVVMIQTSISGNVTVVVSSLGN